MTVKYKDWISANSSIDKYLQGAYDTSHHRRHKTAKKENFILPNVATALRAIKTQWDQSSQLFRNSQQPSQYVGLF